MIGRRTPHQRNDQRGAALVVTPRRPDQQPGDASIGTELLVRLALLEPGSAAWHTLRSRLVQEYLPLVRRLASRFAGRGEPLDDLGQVGVIGLLGAIDRFDATRGVAFVTYATPTILGELRRHFRDRAWAIRVPRQLQEHAQAVSRAAADLTARLARAPTVAELSGVTGLSEEEVLAALDAARVYDVVPLEAGSPRVAAAAEAALANVENWALLRSLLSRLDLRLRQVIGLRFFAGLSQSEIAARLGISQMHVSRLLSRGLATLRGDNLAPASRVALGSEPYGSDLCVGEM